MKMLVALITVIVMLSVFEPSFGYILAYKMSANVKAVDTSIDAPVIAKMKGYLIIDYNDTTFEVNDANLIFYGKDKDKTPAFFQMGEGDLNIDFSPDTNNFIIDFRRGNRNGFEVILTGKTKIRDIGLDTPKVIAGSLKGSMFVWENIYLDTAWILIKGSGIVSAPLSSGLTKEANENSYSSGTVTDSIIAELLDDDYVDVSP